MDKKAKFIIVSLALLALIGWFLSFRFYNERRMINKKYIDLKKVIEKERKTLKDKLDTVEEEKKRIQQKMEAIQKDLLRLSEERDEFKRKYELSLQEKNQLIEKIEKLSTTARVTIPQEKTIQPPAPDAYWAKLLRDKAAMELELNNLEQELQNTKIRLKELEKDKKNLELEIGKLEHKNEELKRELAYNQKITEALSEELVREKNDKHSIQKQLTELKKENTTLRRQLKEANEIKFSLEKRLDKIRQEKETLEEKLKNLKAEKESLTVSQAPPSKPQAKAIELPPIVVRGSRGSSQALSRALSGKILSVNREYNFVVIDLGESMGVKPGDVFSVLRNDKEIAKITVIQTRLDISAADISEVKPGFQVEVGDIIK